MHIALTGSNPNSTEGIVERQLCVRGIYDDECCKSTVSAKMKNCGAFYVYYLAYTDTCDYAYCFGICFALIFKVKNQKSFC